MTFKWTSKNLAKSLICLLLLIFSGCGLLDSDESSVSGMSASRAPLPPRARPVPTEIEVIWRVPEEQVDGYVLRYRLSGSSEVKEIAIDKATLREEVNEEYGNVFRYRLRGVPSTADLAVTMAAVKDGVQSSPSPVMSAPAQ